MGDGSTTIVLVVDGDVVVATCRVEGPGPPDLSVLEAVARLQLAARRLGWSIRLRDPCPRLCELIELVGLPLETRREAEGGEQLGVEEVVQRGDPPL